MYEVAEEAVMLVQADLRGVDVLHELLHVVAIAFSAAIRPSLC